MPFAGGVRLGRIAGIPIILDLSFFVILALFIVLLGTDILPRMIDPEPSRFTLWLLAVVSALVFFMSLLLHELAHSFMARLYGLHVRNITLFLLGGVSQITQESPRAGQEFLIAIVGPLTSAALGGIFLGLFFLTGTGETAPAAMLSWLGIINLALAVFNMIPGFPMDGGRVLRALLWALTGSRARATRWAARLGQLIGLSLVAVGLLGLVGVEIVGSGFGAIWPLFIGAFLFNAAAQALRSVDIEQHLARIRVRDVMSTNMRTMESDLPLRWLAADPDRVDRNAAYMVLREGVVVGIVIGEMLATLDPELFATASMGEVMISADRLPSIAPSATGKEALARLQDEGVIVLPVVEDGRVLGLIGLDQMIHVLRGKPPAPDPAS